MVIVIVLLIFLYFKIVNTNYARNELINIIHVYNQEYDDVSCKDMESYFMTFIRLWDWGYKRILPKEKYELIKHILESGDEDDY